MPPPVLARPFGPAMLVLALVLVACGVAEQPPAAESALGEDQGVAGDWPTYLPDGQPDIEGLWHYVGGSHGLSIEDYPHPAYPNGISPSLVVEPASGIVPFHPWARARRDEVLTTVMDPNPAQVDPQTRGWPDGVPRLNYYSHLIQILQPPGSVVMLYEVQHEFRVIPLDERPHPGSDITLWMGDSRGHWEGNTLVIDVTNHNDSTRFAVTGEFHSDEMRLTERRTFVDPETIEYRATTRRRIQRRGERSCVSNRSPRQPSPNTSVRSNRSRSGHSRRSHA